MSRQEFISRLSQPANPRGHLSPEGASNALLNARATSTSVPPELLSAVGHAENEGRRYAATGDLAALDAAIAAVEQVFRSPTFAATQQDLQRAMFDLALFAFLHRYQQTGALHDLNQALELGQRVVESTPVCSPNRPARLNNMGTALWSRYTRTGDLADLECALVAYQQAVDLTPPDSTDRPGRLTSLGNGLWSRYTRTGDLADLDGALVTYQQAVDLTPPGAPHRPAFLTNLANGLHMRSEQTGNLADLEDALAAYRQAVDLTPPGAPHRPAFLTNLANGLATHYERSDDLADLEGAIVALREAVDLTPPGGPHRPASLTSLGASLRMRYGRTEDMADLEEAINVHREAVDLTPPDAPNRPTSLSGLGTSLRMRYARTGDLADLAGALIVYQQAVDLTPLGAPKRPAFLTDLANGLRMRYELTKAMTDMHLARTYYEQACRGGLDIALDDALQSAQNWGDWALERRAWSEAADAYGYGIRAAERLYRAQAMRSHKETWLREAHGLNGDAAYALARVGRVNEAVVAIEQGRARVVREALARDRAALEQVRTVDQLAYEQYWTAVARVRQLEAALHAGSAGLNTDAGHLGAKAPRVQFEQAWRDLDLAVERIQRVPGVENFLGEPDFHDIIGVVQPGVALIYLIATSVGSVGLVVHRSRGSTQATNNHVQALWLDDFPDTVLVELLAGPADQVELEGWLGAYLDRDKDQQRWFDTLERVTERLWPGVMAPLVTYLSTMAIQEAVLIPAGLLALLPLHAAWTKVNSQRRYALDSISFTVAPSARILDHSKQIAQVSPQEQVLIIDEPTPVTLGGPLPNAHLETMTVGALFGTPRVLAYSQATRTEVLGTLPEVHIAHFACHGATDWDKPLRSGLLLAHDELLTAQDLLQLRLEGARLATLSACETGIIGTALPDEVVGLPSALLQAGFTGVVASLWAVMDLSTALLMERFYRLWRRDELAPAAALREAQRWLRDVPAGELAARFRAERNKPEGGRHMSLAQASAAWRRFASVAPDARPFAPPVYWAAFTFTGT